MISHKKILITGSRGQLAGSFVSFMRAKGMGYSAPDEDRLDIRDHAQIKAVIETVKPGILVNCAAYNLVEEAEDHPDTAFAVNSDAVKNMAEICKANNVFMVHFSSDYVFDGRKEGFYTEEDRPGPLNIYGRSKWKGEEAVQSILRDFLLLRLSWLFGPGKQNFLYKLSQRAQKTDKVAVVTDEVSVPTFTEDVVRATFSALEKGLKGLYHLTNGGRCSRYEWAKDYFAKKGIAAGIQPVTSGHFVLKARRPLNSAMSNKKICDALGISIPAWQDAVGRYVMQENDGQ